MPSKPPRQRTAGIGESPKVRRNPNAEPAERHRCRACREMGTGRLEQTDPDGKTYYLCQECLEAGGQMRLGDA